ncbi:CHAT domain-containing protein [Streptomyces apricus]|uniref:CHAT domain-containing protein n=1 Tax=Streptomyces apricus TaxID=1828112 RepID=A0A5B0BF05_9ACTN|nr:CHAT domain-containing protein [Streptomyces apricus]KAA0940808.1 CHAT domain-containing protein [Streptomyces apricus]
MVSRPDAHALYEEGVALLEDARKRRDERLLSRAIGLLERCADATVAAQTRVAALSALDMALKTRYAWTGELDHLRGATEAGRAALDVRGDDRPDRAVAMVNLADSLRVLAERTGDDAALDEAVRLGEAVDAQGHTDPGLRVVTLNNLGLCLRVRFEAGGDLADIRRAAVVGQRAVDAMPDGYADAASVLSNLAGAHQTWFERTHERSALDRAVDLGRRAAKAAPDGHPSRASILSNLGTALQIRCETTGDSADLQEAIEVGGAAVETTAAHDPALPVRLTNLGTAHVTRFGISGDPRDLDEAVRVLERAIADTDDDDPALAGRLANLCVAARLRFEEGGAASDLDLSVTAGRRAVRECRSDRQRLAGHLSNLGAALRARFRLRQDPADAEESAAVFEQALDGSPTDHPQRAVFLSNLGGVLYEHAELGSPTAPADHRARAVSAFREAAEMPTARTRVRVATGTAWGRVAAELGDWRTAVEGLELAVGQLGLRAPRELGREDQERELAEHAALASDAAACAVRLGDLPRAVTLLEQGRGILLGQSLDTRADLTALRRRDAGLADRFDEVCRGLDSPVPDLGRADAGQERRELADAYVSVLRAIHALPGFETFLAPPAFGELVPPPGTGPAILVNVSELGSDALIVHGDGPSLVPLPLATPEAVRTQVSVLLTALEAIADEDTPDRDAREREERRVRGVLGWLWDAVTGPVLRHLDVAATADPGRRPRVWWIPTGLLSFLPLHAAERLHTDGHSYEGGALDRVVSSYSPTLRSLSFARRPQPPGRDRLLVVSAATVPGHAVLPATRREAARLDRLPVAKTLLTLETATRDRVLAALADHSWAHFVCHATTDTAYPSRSALVLRDHGEAPLRVSDIAAARPAGAKVAYLSACSTAQGAALLPDEGIHITSAFHLAGYRQVVGTLWPIDDHPAGRITRDFYEGVVVAEGLSAEAAASALHSAVHRARRRTPGHPSVWAAHVHVGA